MIGNSQTLVTENVYSKSNASQIEKSTDFIRNPIETRNWLGSVKGSQLQKEYFEEVSTLLKTNSEKGLGIDSNYSCSKENPIKFLPRTHDTHQDYFIPLQKWEGVIMEVGKDFFVAQLADLTNNNPEEIAEFSVDEIGFEDRDLVREGAIFYWSIGYFDKPSGRLRSSIIRFRRVPTWFNEEIENAKQIAEQKYQISKWL
jgi:hypothetical protein